MKNLKTIILLILSGTVTFTVGLWFYSTMEPLSPLMYSIAGGVFITVIFSLVIAIKKLKDAKQGIPPDDEMSIKIKQKAAASAFSYSFYLWCLIIMFMVDMEIRPSIPIGIGITGMGLLFIGFWVYYSKTGIGIENKD